MTIVDGQSQFHNLLASYIISSSKILTPYLNEDIAHTIIKNSFSKNGRTAIQLFLSLRLFFSWNKFKFLKKSLGIDTKEGFGKSFDIDVDDTDPNKVITKVNKCAFNQFFKAHGHENLTPLMCEWDNNWVSVIKRYPSFKHTYHNGIALGENSCIFACEKIK